ncbi:MAG: prohibitin family protein [Bacteroidota bacterium]|nr:prohibitin family protein [Bacteroidota bacterium]MDP4230709.1 prohibitin family protein [Bacteroidota bacterium]MDP4237470.1 prohibitin family protein [Bacteroidota bacterium]
MFTGFVLFLIIAVVAFIARARTSPTANTRTDNHKIFGIIFRVAIGVAIVFLVLSTATVVPAGNVGVQILYGNVQPDALENGFHVINPLYEIKPMDVRTQAYTMSATHNEGQVKGDDAIEVLTSDGLTLKLEITVQYRLLPSAAAMVYRTIGEDYTDKIVRPEIRSALRDKAVNYVSTDLYSIKREDFVTKVTALLEEGFKKRGLVLEGMLLRDVSLPQSVQQSINAKISAQQDAQKMEFVLQKEKQEADRKRIEAQGIQDFQKIVAQGLSREILELKGIEATQKLAESPNAKIVVIGNPKNGLPLVLGQQ